MIAVRRVAEPACLTQNAVQWKADLCRARVDYYQLLRQHAANPQGKAPRKPGAKSNCYGHDDVKSALSTMFGEKCCYCEVWVTHVSWRHVEHFRPASIYPALAYDWNNLLYACPECNSTAKGGHFPLAPTEGTPREDQTNPCVRDDNDNALLIDPCRDKPSDHLEFIGPLLRAKRNSATGVLSRKGELTIKVCGLRRVLLVRDRRKMLTLASATIEMYLIAKAKGNASKEQHYATILLDLCEDHAEYASMFRAELKRNGISWRSLY